MDHTRLVFLDQADWDDLEDVAAAAGWDEVELDPDAYDSENFPSRLWNHPGGTVRFVDDTVLRLQFVDIVPPSAEAEAAIRDRFEARERDELAGLVDLDAPAERVVRSLRRLAAGLWRTPYSEPIASLILDALDSPNDDIVGAAMSSVNRTRWTEFRPRVDELSGRTSDAWVRAAAENAQLRLSVQPPEGDWSGEYDL